jgi:hypothetical protein
VRSVGSGGGAGQDVQGGEEADYRTPLLEHLAGGPRQLEQVGLALAFGAAEEQTRTELPLWGESAVGPHIAFLEAHRYTVAKIEPEEMAGARRGR